MGRVMSRSRKTWENDETSWLKEYTRKNIDLV